MKPSVLFSTAVSFALLVGCTRPLLVEGDGPFATVELTNASIGYAQFMTFEDPQKCDNPQLIGYGLNAGQSRNHRLPADRVITISVGAVGMPTEPGKISWCSPIFVSTKLVNASSYRVSFNADAAEKVCFVRIIDAADGQSVPAVQREGTGAPIGSGTLSGPIACTPDPAIEQL